MFIRTVLLALLLLVSTGCVTKPKVVVSPIYTTNKIANEAQKHLGKPYKYGAIGPNSFDCSGFIYSVHKSFGIQLPRTSLEQSKIRGYRLSKAELKVGDMVFFDTSSKGHVNHTGIYLGNSKFIHASSGKAYSVTISDMNGWYRDKFRWGKHIDENK